VLSQISQQAEIFISEALAGIECEQNRAALFKLGDLGTERNDQVQHSRVGCGCDTGREALVSCPLQLFDVVADGLTKLGPEAGLDKAEKLLANGGRKAVGSVPGKARGGLSKPLSNQARLPLGLDDLGDGIAKGVKQRPL